MTKQAVVVKRKMDTPIAVVATLGIESIFSGISVLKTTTHKLFKDFPSKSLKKYRHAD